MPAPSHIQHHEVTGLSIVASPAVSTYAMAEAAWLVRHVVPEPDARTLASHGVHLIVVGAAESVTDRPEYASLTPARWWNRRCRGMGPTEELPYILCSEEDLLRLPGRDDDGGTSVCLHELVHAVDYAHALRHDALGGDLERAHAQAAEQRRWPDSYEMSSAGEYFVAGAMTWLGAPPPVAVAAGVTSREALRRYDPPLAALCERAFGDLAWRYEEPDGRASANRRHLRGFDPSRVAPFTWPESARWDAPGVALSWADSPLAVRTPSEDPGWLILANRRHDPVEVARVARDGTPTTWSTLRSGEERLQDIHAGEVWAVRRTNGDELGRIVAPSGVHAFEIASRALPRDDGTLRAMLAPDASRLEWDSAPTPASPPSDDLVWLLFSNARDHAVRLEWLDFDGGWHPMDTIAPHETLLRDAYVGHVWRVRANDEVIGTITAGRDHARVEIQ